TGCPPWAQPPPTFVRPWWPGGPRGARTPGRWAHTRRRSGTGPGPGRADGSTGPLMRILVVNAGSSSLKLRLVGDDDDLLGSEDLCPIDRLPDGELGRALRNVGGAGGGGRRV